jgi:hypothetical protein
LVKLNLRDETLQRLRELTGTISYQFLGFTLNLQESIITDNFGQSAKYFNEWQIQLLSTLLTHYSTGALIPLSGKLTKFRDLPGGCAYEGAFIKRAIQPVADVFGKEPKELPKAAQLLGGTTLKLGDASTEIPALKGIPLTYILYGAEEYPASANILYDESASNYLPTEDLAVLGEITTIRLIEACKKG